MNGFLSGLPIRLCILLVLSATSSARADDALPSQDQGLAGALENHPDIVAAKAKVALANAELYGKRIEVSRQVLGLYGALKKLDAKIDASKEAINRSKTEFGKPGGASKDRLAAELRASEAQLVQSISQREQAAKELQLLVGTAPMAAESKTLNLFDGAGSRVSRKTVVARQTPQGSIVDKMKAALEKPIKLDFADTPLGDTLGYLSDKTGIMFSLQRDALEAAGIAADQPISINTSEVPLHAALQAFQDYYPQLRFVLRDYGVLVTAKEYSEEHGYAPVLEMGKELAATPKSR